MTHVKSRQGLWQFLLVIAALALGACGSSGGGGDAGDETGELTISLTDAEGDFNQYTVDVVSLTLHKANGAIVETLPNRVRLDFSRYIEVTEFLSTATVPVGTYRQAQITLDYSNAGITVEDAIGNSIPGFALDAHGNPLTTITVDMMFNEHSGFTITPGKPAAITLDFDLEASNEVVINGNSATVTVNPVLLANTQIEEDKTQRLRGLLGRVNLEAETFNVNIRPFRIRHRDFGRITAHTDAQTVFEIDGVAYHQQAGLEVLARQTGLTPVVTLGTFNFRERRFLAHQVYAGTSVPWGDKDLLKGSVVARNLNTLTVIGATVEFDDGHFSFNDEIEVLIDESTRVTKQGDPGNQHEIDDTITLDLCETLMQDYVLTDSRIHEFPDSIELIALDFDGVLTDNRVYLDQGGTETVSCNRSDGLRIKEAEQTGINRGTITRLYHETASRIELDVIEKLCVFFECQVGELFEYRKD